MPHLIARLAVGGALLCEQHLATDGAGRGADERGVSARARRAARARRRTCGSRTHTRARRRPRRPLRGAGATRRQQDGVIGWRVHTNFALRTATLPRDAVYFAIAALRHRQPPGSRRRIAATAQEPSANPSAGPTRAARGSAARRFARSTSRSTTSSTRAIPRRTRRSIAGPTKCTSARATRSSQDMLLFAPGDASSRGCSTSRLARCARGGFIAERRRARQLRPRYEQRGRQRARPRLVVARARI